MKNENFITIQGWMVNKLCLTGNDLICYALIYGFTQNGEYWDKSTKYISEWLGVSTRSVMDIIKRLVDKNLLDKQDYSVNGVKFCKYRVNTPNLIPYEESSLPPYEESSQCQNNIETNKEEKENIKRKKESEEPTAEEHAIFEEFRNAYKGRKRGHDTEFNFFISQNKDWRDVLPLLGYAIQKENALRKQARMMKKFFPEQKNLQTYLNGKNRAWEFYALDLSDTAKNEYTPQCDGINLFWNDVSQCYTTMFDIETLSDGYNSESRPHGAVVMWRGWKYTWNGSTKQWIKQ